MVHRFGVGNISTSVKVFARALTVTVLDAQRDGRQGQRQSPDGRVEERRALRGGAKHGGRSKSCLHDGEDPPAAAFTIALVLVTTTSRRSGTPSRRNERRSPTRPKIGREALGSLANEGSPVRLA